MKHTFKMLSVLSVLGLSSISGQNHVYASDTYFQRAPASTCASLDDKLSHLFSLYEKANDEFINKKLSSRSYLSRTALEQIITPTGSCQFNSSDLDELSKRHEDMISSARLEAIDESIIDISKVQQDGALDKFCRDLPKGGVLHLHPSGILDDDTIQELGDRSTRKYFLADSQHSFENFDSIFAHLRGLLGMGLSSNLKHGIDKYLERASKEGVIYVEFGKLFRDYRDSEEKLASWARDFYNDHGVVVKWKAGFVRVHGYGAIQSQVDSLIEAEYRHRKYTGDTGFSHIVGVDLYGNERNDDALSKGQHLVVPLSAMANDKHPRGWKTEIKTTIHAGEIGNPKNPRDAMIMGVDRIGHGVSIAKNPLDMEFARVYKNGQGLPIEINLVSNYRLSAIGSFNEHPFLDYLRLGMPVSFSTDDEGIFQTTISTECEVAVENSDIQYSELKKASYNSIEHAFADDNTKAQLKQRLDSMFADFENEWTQKYGK